MNAENAIRAALSAFLLILVVVAATGWVWVGGHQGPTQSAASRVVLSLCILAGRGGLVGLWGRKPTR